MKHFFMRDLLKAWSILSIAHRHPVWYFRICFMCHVIPLCMYLKYVIHMKPFFISSCTCSCDSHHLRHLPRDVVKCSEFNDFWGVEQRRGQGSLLYSKKSKGLAVICFFLPMGIPLFKSVRNPFPHIEVWEKQSQRMWYWMNKWSLC